MTRLSVTQSLFLALALYESRALSWESPRPMLDEARAGPSLSAETTGSAEVRFPAQLE